MPIRTMTTRERAYDADGNLRADVEIVRDYNGHDEGVHHGPGCIHAARRRGADKAFTAECVRTVYLPVPGDEGASYPRNYAALVDAVTGAILRDAAGEPRAYTGGYCDECRIMEPLYMETTHVGMVIGDGELNGYDESDFYAIVWDAAAGAPREITYGTTRGWTYPNSCTVDATPDVWAAYEAHRAKQQAAYEAMREKERQDDARRECLVPRVGQRARVVRGRKVPIGTAGTVVWYGHGNYGLRVGIRTDADETVWTAADNVENVDGAAKPDGATWCEWQAENARRATASRSTYRAGRAT